MRTVVAAACRTIDGKVWHLPKPARHDKVLLLISNERGPKATRREVCTQGFLDQDGVFLTRHEALEVARNAGQADGIIGGVLTSEDLW